MVIVEKLEEWKLTGETEVLGENPPQRHFIHHKSLMTGTAFEPGPPRWEASELFFLYLMGWDFGYCGHYWPIVPAPDDR
jgi:hypothetical protein